MARTICAVEAECHEETTLSHGFKDGSGDDTEGSRGEGPQMKYIEPSVREQPVCERARPRATGGRVRRAPSPPARQRAAQARNPPPPVDAPARIVSVEARRQAVG
jgi:hypothetical protein